MVIRIIDVTGGADTAAQGAVVRDAVLSALQKTDAVLLSFDGIKTASSSFVNVGLVQLLDHMTFDELKRRLSFTRSNYQISDMIKRCFSRPHAPQNKAA